MKSLTRFNPLYWKGKFRLKVYAKNLCSMVNGHSNPESNSLFSQVGEQLGEWTFRFAQSRNTRIAGPAFILLGVLMFISSIVLCIFSRRVNSVKDYTAVYTQHVAAPNQICSEQTQNNKQRRLDISTYSVVQSQEKSYFTNG